MHFAARKTVVVQRFARLRTNLGKLRIFNNYSTSAHWINEHFILIISYRANLLNNKWKQKKQSITPVLVAAVSSAFDEASLSKTRKNIT